MVNNGSFNMVLMLMMWMFMVTVKQVHVVEAFKHNVLVHFGQTTAGGFVANATFSEGGMFGSGSAPFGVNSNSSIMAVSGTVLRTPKAMPMNK